ncbi:gluconokinase [Oricola nitratireducens]|uniref:gluconokinase n=1 Tax=Oricola nitratireducens TaxID=2775868 RepID=UPI0018670A9F|nr:gluconokinase, GntK/IdnK-type [Oricola nitratireducens]
MSIDDGEGIDAFVVMGVCGVGKTTLGRALAARLCAAFVEADDHHPQSSKDMMAAGIPLTDAEREPWLLSISADARQRRVATGMPVVIACSALRRRYRALLSTEIGRVYFLYLTGDEDELRARIARRRDHFMPASMLDSQLATLEPLGSDEPGMALDFERGTEALVAEVLGHYPLET